MKKFRSSLVFMTILLTVIIITSCDQQKDVEERNKASLLKAHEELFDKGNLDYADEVFTKEYAGQGPEWIKDYVRERREAFPDLETTVEPVIAEGNMIAWQRTQTGTHNSNFMGFKPTGKKITWKNTVLTRYTNDGKIAEEWGVGNIDEVLQNASGIDGVYEYLPPLKGQSIVRNGQFVYLFGPADGKAPMISQAGTHMISGDTVKNKVTYCTDPKQIGSIYLWRVTAWSGDTVSVETMNEKGELTGGARSVRVSR